MRTGKRTKRAIMGSLDQAYLPNTYTTQSTPASREATVFYGDFDPEIVPLDFELRDFDTLGASISIPSHSRYVGSIGPVFLGNGNGNGKLPVQSSLSTLR